MTSIKARVTWKSEITQWNNAGKDGIIFIMNLLDESGEITGVVFNNLINAFYGQIQTGLVYIFSRFQVQQAENCFKVSKNPFAVFLLWNTVVELSASERIPRETYNFLPLSEVSTKPDKEPVDAIGICTEVRDLDHRGGHSIREILLVDPDYQPVMLNLWEKEAENFEGRPDDVIVVKGARAQPHNNAIKLNASWYTNVQINPDIPDATSMLEWYRNQ
ncbi:replication protein A 70 kDa DNA-binding subunit isoform X2 [Drosophila erecta]|nr:replication protein A 70 kDa DNA-binding subunit isoform X2 [Drosophila erecta]